MSDDRGNNTVETVAKTIFVLFLISVFLRFCSGRDPGVTDAELHEADQAAERVGR